MKNIHDKIATLQSVLDDRVRAAGLPYCIDVTQSDLVGRIDVDVLREEGMDGAPTLRLVVWANAQTEAVSAVVLAAVRALP